MSIFFNDLWIYLLEFAFHYQLFLYLIIRQAFRVWWCFALVTSGFIAILLTNYRFPPIRSENKYNWFTKLGKHDHLYLNDATFLWLMSTVNGEGVVFSLCQYDYNLYLYHLLWERLVLDKIVKVGIRGSWLIQSTQHLTLVYVSKIIWSRFKMINQITCVRFQDWFKRIKLIVFSNIGSPLPKWHKNYKFCGIIPKYSDLPPLNFIDHQETGH